MSKKRASKKRRRESQRPASNKEPRLVLITTAANETKASPAQVARPGAAQVEPVEALDSAVDAIEPRSDVVERVPEAKPKVEKREQTRAKSETRAAEPVKAEDFDEEQFFHEGHIQTPQAFAIAEEIEPEPPRPSLKMTPVARARRAHFSKYVKGAMVAGTAILLLAGIRVASGRGTGPENYPTAATLAPRATQVEVAPIKQSAPDPIKLAEAIPPPDPDLADEPEPVKAAEPKVAEPAKAAEAPKTEPVAAAVAPAAAVPAAAAKVEAKPAEPAKPEVAKAEPTKPVEVAPGGKTALEEKTEARKLLERGKAGGAIEAGERSVALDPADGEAWLILGAAYQEKGNLKEARRAFNACLKEAKRGPKAECKAMLQ